MRFLLWFICFNLSEGRADGQIGRNIDNIYPNDPIKELTRHDLNQIDLDEEPEDEIDISKLNRKWKTSIKHNPEQKKFVEFMISRIPDGLPLSPQILMEMNREPYCFVNLAYDSGKDDFEEIRFLAMAISSYFHERCGLGLLDISYPSNKFTFGDVIQSTPSFLIKRPHREHKMLRLHHEHLDPNHLHLNDIEEWGLFVPVFEKQKELGIEETFKMINILYEYESSANLKVMSIYMPHYKNKKYVRDMITGIRHFFHDKIHKEAENHKLYPGEFDSKKHDVEIYEKLFEEYGDFMKTTTEEVFWNQLDLGHFLEDIAKMKEHILHPEQQKKFSKDLVHTIPDPQPDLHLLIHEKTVLYPTDEMLRKRKEKFRELYANALKDMEEQAAEDIENLKAGKPLGDKRHQIHNKLPGFYLNVTLPKEMKDSHRIQAYPVHPENMFPELNPKTDL